MNIHIETERLILRDIEEGDTQGMFELDSDPDVHEYLAKRPISTMEQAEQMIAMIREHYVRHGMGRWAIIDKASEEFLGWAGLKYEERLRKEFSYYDLGYRLQKRHWGKGIATEAAEACLAYGFEHLNLSEIGAGADVDHVASIRILTKIGLKLVDTFDFEGNPCNWYNLERSEWMKTRTKS